MTTAPMTSVMQRINKLMNLDEPQNPVVPLNTQDDQESLIRRKSMENELEVDFQEARKALKTVMEIGSQAADELHSVAQSTEHAAHYQSLAGIVKATADAAERLVDISKKKMDILVQDKKLPGAEASTNITQQAVFVGDSAQLLHLLKDKGKELEDGQRLLLE